MNRSLGVALIVIIVLGVVANALGVGQMADA